MAKETIDYRSADPKSAQPGFFREMLGHLGVSIVATIVLCVLLSGVYPLVVWGIAQVPGLRAKADGSLIYSADGKTPIASRLIGQSFSDPRYFQPRPSAAGNGYDPTATGGSNLGPTSAKLFNGTTQPSDSGPAVAHDGIKLRTLLYAQANGIAIAQSSQPLSGFQNASGAYDQVKLIEAFNDATNPLTFKTATPIPADAVTASGSGVDPHISIDNAMIQLPRVAKARGMSQDAVKRLIDENTDGRDLGFIGEAGVNVVALNVALDRAR